MPAYLYRSAGGDLTATDRASAVSLLTSLGSAYEGQVRIVVAGETIGRVAWVGSAIEDLSGYERSDGSYGVVASVDGPNQVTLAAGYTLGVAGRCRLWDVTGTTHLDSGGVEWRRSGAVVTLPDTTGLAAGDVVYSDRLEVTSYASAVALETALGTSFNGEIRVVNKTSGAVILRRVVRSGAWTSVEVNFANVSASKYGLVAAVVDGTTATLTAGHTMPASGTAYVWDTSGAVALGTAVAFTVAVNTMTVADTTGWAAGDQVWIADTELCVGTGCAIVPEAGSTAIFSGTYFEGTGHGTINVGTAATALDVWHFVAAYEAVRSAAADGQYAGVGVLQTAALQSSACARRVAGVDRVDTAYAALAAPTFGAAGFGEAAAVWGAGQFSSNFTWAAGVAYATHVQIATKRRAYHTASPFTGAPTKLCWHAVPAGAESVSIRLTSVRTA